jgi:hypothetical protein
MVMKYTSYVTVVNAFTVITAFKGMDFTDIIVTKAITKLRK